MNSTKTEDKVCQFCHYYTKNKGRGWCDRLGAHVARKINLGTGMPATCNYWHQKGRA